MKIHNKRRNFVQAHTQRNNFIQELNWKCEIVMQIKGNSNEVRLKNGGIGAGKGKKKKKKKKPFQCGIGRGSRPWTVG